jgi:hypothetical protein
MSSVSKWALVGIGLLGYLGATSGALAQERRERPDDSKTSDLSGEVSASAVLASDRGDDEDEAARSGFILRGGLDYDREVGPGEIRLSYDTAAFLYEDNDRPDRWSNRVALRYALPLANDFEVSARLAYATNLATLEFRSADQSEVFGMAEYSPGDHRFRLNGGWRWRDYDDEAGSEASGLFLGAEYRYRFGRDQFFTTELRYEDIDSADPRRGYERTILEAFYQHPLGRMTRLRVGGSARWWEFDDRLAPNGEPRRDSAVTPEVQLLHDFRSGLLLRGRLQYGLRNSNDPAEDGDDRRATLTTGYRF